MATSAELDQAIKAEIAALVSFPYTISIATQADDNDILALVIAHSDNLDNACNWGKMTDEGEAGIRRLRLGRVTVLARDKNLRGMITYVPDDPMCWLQAIAVDASLPLNEQLRLVYAMSIVAQRAMLKLGCAEMWTRAFPPDSRMVEFAGALRKVVPMKVAENKDSDGKVTSWSFALDVAESLAWFEGAI